MGLAPVRVKVWMRSTCFGYGKLNVTWASIEFFADKVGRGRRHDEVIHPRYLIWIEMSDGLYFYRECIRRRHLGPFGGAFSRISWGKLPRLQS